MNSKRTVIKILLITFYTFCIVSIVIASINVYKMKMNENRLLNVDNKINIEDIGD